MPDIPQRLYKAQMRARRLGEKQAQERLEPVGDIFDLVALRQLAISAQSY